MGKVKDIKRKSNDKHQGCVDDGTFDMRHQLGKYGQKPLSEVIYGTL